MWKGESSASLGNKISINFFAHGYPDKLVTTCLVSPTFDTTHMGHTCCSGGNLQFRRPRGLGMTCVNMVDSHTAPGTQGTRNNCLLKALCSETQGRQAPWSWSVSTQLSHRYEDKTQSARTITEHQT